MNSRAVSALVCIAIAETPTDTLRMQLMLDRTRVPYTMRGIQGTEPLWPGRVAFMVAAEMELAAREGLHALFEIESRDLPRTCPCCDTPTLRGSLDCPGCGLFLG